MTLQDYINLAEAASKGPWEDGNEAIFTQAHDKGRVWNGTVFLGKCSEHILLNLTFAEEAEQAANDARFIAASRTLGPAMAEALIEAEEALRDVIESVAECESGDICQMSNFTGVKQALSTIQKLKEQNHE